MHNIDIDYPVFCFKHLQTTPKKDHEFYSQYIVRLKQISQLSWNQINVTDRHGYGTEKMPVEQIKLTLPKFITPDVLVKGADWNENKIVGSDVVKDNGGKVTRVTFTSLTSSTQIIYSILRKFGKEGTCQLHGDNEKQFEESRPD